MSVNKMYSVLLCLQLYWCTSQAYYGDICQKIKAKEVPQCPLPNEIEELDKKMECSALCGPGFHLQCVRDHSMTKLYLLCAPRILLGRYCPEFNVGGHVVQNDHDAPYNYSCTTKDCLIYSTDMHKHPFCLTVNESNVTDESTVNNMSHASDVSQVTKPTDVTGSEGFSPGQYNSANVPEGECPLAFWLAIGTMFISRFMYII